MRAGEGYPGQQAAQPSGQAGQLNAPADYPGTPAGYLVGPGGQSVGPGGYPVGPGGQPPGPGGRRKSTWPTWWIAPFFGGALVVLAVFALVQVTVLRHPAGHASPATSSPGAVAPKGPMPAQEFP